MGKTRPFSDVDDLCLDPLWTGVTGADDRRVGLAGVVAEVDHAS